MLNKILAASVIAASLSACSTQQQQQIISVACTANKLAPSLVSAGSTIATIVDPASVDTVSKISAAEASLHPIVQAACASALPGSVPVAGTINTTSVPVAPPISQTTAVILPVSASLPNAQSN